MFVQQLQLVAVEAAQSTPKSKYLGNTVRNDSFKG